MKITHCGPTLDVPRIITPAFAPLSQQCRDPPHVCPALLPGDGPLRKRTPGRPHDPGMEFAHTCLPANFGALSIIRGLLKEYKESCAVGHRHPNPSTCKVMSKMVWGTGRLRGQARPLFSAIFPR